MAQRVTVYKGRPLGVLLCLTEPSYQVARLDEPWLLLLTVHLRVPIALQHLGVSFLLFVPRVANEQAILA